MDILFASGENFINIALNFAVIIVLILYIIFSLIIVRQVQLMSKVIVTGVNKYVHLLSLVHLLFAVIMSIVIILAIT